VTANIDTAQFSAQWRGRGVDVDARRLRITNLRGSEQEADLTSPANCGGFGRVRHFRRDTSTGWPSNPLPLLPAARALGLAEPPDVLRAQVFQNAVCNWRCWYCYVDFPLLSGSDSHSSWLSAAELVEMYLAENDRPAVIDLSGGQPDLVPEWVPWMMAALREAGIADEVYLWSDDNLSTDYFWRYLDEETRAAVSAYERYGKVCCFKGYDSQSFSFNTKATPELFDQQFEVMRRLLQDTSIDLYAYATFTTPTTDALPREMSAFLDRLQALDPRLPLRTVPLEVVPFTPVHSRMSREHSDALAGQQHAIAAWNAELDRRFTAAERALDITDVELRGG
jgi:uncharacterized Fe-S cluster-containing radical SAM superfamily protein